MSRKSSIRWREVDEQNLTKAVRNFNAKIRRLEKKYPELKYALPEKVSTKEMKEVIKSRADFNREIKSLQRFTSRPKKKTNKKGQTYYHRPEDLVKIPGYERDPKTKEIIKKDIGNEYNTYITRWQSREMSLRASVITRKRLTRRDEINALERTSRGQPLGYTIKEMGGVRDKDLIATNPFPPTLTRTQAHKKMKAYRKESSTEYWADREDLLKQNYIKALEQNFSSNEAKPVIDAIKKMDYKEFYKVFVKEEQGKFEWAYHIDKKTHDENLALLKLQWGIEEGN